MFKFKEIIKCSIFITLLILTTFGSANTINAQELDKPQYYKSFSYFTGYTRGKLDVQDDYVVIPSIFRFAFDVDAAGIGAADIVEHIADKMFNNPGLEVKGETEFLTEFFANAVVSPDNNQEVGFDILVKYSYPVTEKINPYFFTGGGIIYTSQHTHEQSTQWNFLPQAAVGVSYDLKEDFSIDMEWRYRHLSNANRKLPNDGINVYMFLIGATWKY